MNSIAKKAALAVVTAGLAAGASAGVASATSDAQAQGTAANSPGVGSGNLVEAPVHVPVNATGNSVNVVGVLNPVFGNASVNR
ncbi:chaplin [Streptomyces sp. WAC 01529]|uniref:chaplin n=1 Tax=Streptomyces sp. WAC 01529 TaxID=2203205 RepID=UPI000F6E6704|nr:chaplin [Streptomyces sp. WAC 01529]AZM52480.1 chaplin [Streptomyces sp. WAC 01529]